MTTNLITLPSALSLLIICLLFLNWYSTFVQKLIHVLGLCVLWTLSLVITYQVHYHHFLTLQMGGWQAPFGITFIADGLAAIVFLATSTVLLCGGLYALADIDERQFKSGFLLAFWVLTLGICGAIFTGDLFNLYVWFEVILIGSFILLGLGKPSVWLYNKFKYVVINLVGTFLMLTAIALMYGYTGTLNMASFAQVVMSQSHTNGLLFSIILIFFISLGIKTAIFPVFNWLPAAYHSTSHTTSSLMGGLITKVGLYVIIRFLFNIYPVHNLFLNQLLLLLAMLTMIVGVLGALAQYDYRRILAFDIISQVGLMFLAIGLFSRAAIAAGIFFLVHNILTKMTLFLTSGIAYTLTGQQDIRRMGGIYEHHPKIAWLFFIPALSLAGLPPLAGFWAKFLIIKAAFIDHQFILVTLILIVSLLTLIVMTKIWHLAYWQPSQTHLAIPNPKPRTLTGLALPTFLGVIAILVLSLYPWPFYEFINSAAKQLVHPQLYIHAVLGGPS